MHTCSPSHWLKRSWHSCPRRVIAGNRNTQHPPSSNKECDCLNGWIKKWSHRQNSHQNEWTPEIQLGTQNKKLWHHVGGGCDFLILIVAFAASVSPAASCSLSRISLLSFTYKGSGPEWYISSMLCSRIHHSGPEPWIIIMLVAVFLLFFFHLKLFLS